LSNLIVSQTPADHDNGEHTDVNNDDILSTGISNFEPSMEVLDVILNAKTEYVKKAHEERDNSLKKATKLAIEVAESRETIDVLTEQIKQQELALMNINEQNKTKTQKIAQKAAQQAIRLSQSATAATTHNNNATVAPAPSVTPTKTQIRASIMNNKQRLTNLGAGIAASMSKIGQQQQEFSLIAPDAVLVQNSERDSTSTNNNASGKVRRGST